MKLIAKNRNTDGYHNMSKKQINLINPTPKLEKPTSSSRIENNTTEDNTIKDGKNKAIKDRIIKAVRTLFESEKSV